MRPEIKHHDTIVNGAIVATGTSVLVSPLTYIVQGISSRQRIGLKIQPVMLQMKFCMESTKDACVYWMIVKFKANNSTNAFDALEIWDTLVPHPRGMRNQRFRGMYKIIKEGRVTFSPNETALEKKVYRQFSLKLRAPIWYVSTAADAAASGMGHLFFVATSDRVVADATPKIDSTFRIYYHDQ